MESVPVVAFFNHQGGPGKTTLVYHLAWMLAHLGYRTLAVDLDPQSNLTAAFLDEERLEQIWEQNASPQTISGCLQPLFGGSGDVLPPVTEEIDTHLSLLPGNLTLAGFEDELSAQWPGCLAGQEPSLRLTTAFWRVIQAAAVQRQAQLVLMDLGPNLGALNRAALVASERVIIPLAPDLFGVQGLRGLGPALRRWRQEWANRSPRALPGDWPLPPGSMTPGGYIVMQHAARLERPVYAYERWIVRTPGEYRQAVLAEPSASAPEIGQDPFCLGLLKPYRSLLPMAQEARKPIFYLKPADGAVGAHMKAVEAAYLDFKNLANKIYTTGVVN